MNIMDVVEEMDVIEAVEEAWWVTAPEDPSWALINLILTIAVGVVAVLLITAYILRRKGDKVLPILGVVGTGLSVILFALSQDMSQPMVISDRSTLWHVGIVIVAAFLLFVSRLDNKRDKK